MESIVDAVTQPPAVGDLGVEEPQSLTPEGRTQLIRDGLVSAITATNTMVIGIEDAGTPDTAHGKQAAGEVSDWAHGAKNDLEQAHNALHTQATDLQDAVRKVTEAATAITTSLTTGIRTIVGVGRLDPELATALAEANSCQRLREEQTST
jgi:hypothetical protein